jgi:hypothetical protein
LVSQALIQQPNDEAAWMLMADLVEDVRQRRNCLERVLAINPKNSDASIAMTKLNTSPLSPVTRGERDNLLNLPKIEKIQPFAWEAGEEQYPAQDELPPTDEPSEQPEQPAETQPTFDWANDSAEPDKTIHKIFAAVSSPESVYQPLPAANSYLSENDTSIKPAGAASAPEEDQEARLLDELVGMDAEREDSHQPSGLEGFTVSSVPQLILDDFNTMEQTNEPGKVKFLLWDNPNAKKDRLVILSSKSLIYANPKATDIPHIEGLFAENKMMRDLLGEHTGIIKLEAIQRVTANPKKHSLVITHQMNKKTSTQKFKLASEHAIDEVMAAFHKRLGPDFSHTRRIFSLPDKIVPPLVVLVFVLFMIWVVTTGIPMLSNVPISKLGQLQYIFPGLQVFVSSIGVFNLVLISGIFGLLSLIWLTANLVKPSRLEIIERK